MATKNCPSGPAVTQELRRLFPAIDVTTATDPANRGDAVVQEQPGGFVVTLSEFRRYFDDPAGRCAERAQMAAVFIAIALEPPKFPSAPLEAPPPSPPSPPADSGAATPSRLDVELGPTLQVAPGAGTRDRPLALGGGGRLRWGRTVSVSLGAGIWSSTTLHYPQSDARALWLPLDLGIRVTREREAWEGGAEASLLVAPVRLEGASLPLSTPRWRAEVGARGAALARWWLANRVGVFAGAYAVVLPRPYTLRVLGAGDVGTTPRVWLGAEVGVTFRIH